MNEASCVWFLKYKPSLSEDQETKEASFWSLMYPVYNGGTVVGTVVATSVKTGGESKSLSNFWPIAIVKSRQTPVTVSLIGAQA